MNPKKIKQMGMELDEWKIESCVAHFAIGESKNGPWATLYAIISKEKNKGHATKLLADAKKYYEAQNRQVGGSVALNPIMKHIYKKLKYHEYK